jgi:hypothetical protein
VDEEAIWELRAGEAWDNPVRLRQLHKDLGENRVHGPLRFRVAHRLVELRKRSEAPSPLGEIFAGYGLEEPDGRRLYQYRLSDDGFSALHSKLKKGGPDQIDLGFGPAQFALWAAEWFRRYHPGGLRKWEDLEGALGFARNQNQWRETTRRGLQQLRRPIISTDSFRYFLSTLAREGGFPTAALQADQQSWASDVMRTLVSTLLAEGNPTETRAFNLADSLRGRMPAVFADEDFLQLCADLALAIVGIRKGADADALAAGIPLAAWLDAKRPGWKSSLPITLDGRSDGLINQLMSVRPQRLASGHLDAARYLAWLDGKWNEAAVLELNGDITKAVRQRLAGTSGRLQVFASGDLARYLPGEIGYIESDGCGEYWMQALDRRSEMRLVPFRCALDIEIRSPDRAEARLRLPGDSDPLRASLIVMTAERETDGTPVELMVRGTGSGKYRQEVLYVQIPDSWEMRATSDEEAVSSVGPGPGGTIWRVEGGAVAVSDRGDLYRLICGQAAEAVDRIELTARSLPSFIRPRDRDVLLIRQPVKLRLLSGSRAIPENGRLFVRTSTSRQWTRLDGEAPTGMYEIAWREGDVIRDRRMVAVLPPTAEISRYGTGRSTSYPMKGFGECTVRPDADAPVRITGDRSEMKATHQSVVNRTFGAKIVWGVETDSQICDVIIDFPSGAGIARWDGRIIRASDRISLSDLDDVAAYADGRMEIHGRILDGEGKVIPGTEMKWAFEEEMPLSVLSEDLRRAMVPAGLHAKAQLGMHDSIETYWQISQYTSGLRKEPGGLVSPIGVIDEKVTLCARARATYWLEKEIEVYSLIDRTNHRPVTLPDCVKGPSIAFLRDGERVITCPIFQLQPGLETCSDVLGKAMTHPDNIILLEQFLHSAAGSREDSEKPVQGLLRLVTSLRGLPPSAFRVLEMLPEYPTALARMLAFASPEDLPDVLDLEISLPFAWFTIPRSVWEAVMGEVFDDALARLQDQGVGNDASRYAAEKISALRSELMTLHPVLGRLIFPDPEVRHFADILQSFLNRNVDRVAGKPGSIFRDELGDRLPARLLQLPAHCLEVMDAPCAAAAAALGDWTPGAQETARMKLIARRFPDFFGEAFAFCIAERSSQRIEGARDE